MLSYDAVRVQRSGRRGTSCLVLQILPKVIILVLVSTKVFKCYLWSYGHNVGSRFDQVLWQDQTSLPNKKKEFGINRIFPPDTTTTSPSTAPDHTTTLLQHC
jgi:hypothetical protein